jgi:hypothetical protein
MVQSPAMELCQLLGYLAMVGSQTWEPDQLPGHVAMVQSPARELY